jgi:hypothetical protein
MTFTERMQGIIERGVGLSKDLAGKAGEKAKDLGAKGLLKLEIVQLESHAEKLIAKLGNEVYRALVDRNQDSVSKDAPWILAILREIEGLRAQIDLKEKEYRSIGGK